jgi:TM2 domain-containing membrane protein YozV
MKKRFVAVLLAIFVGSFGVHKFYLRQPELGIGYIALFIWFGRFFGFPISAFLAWYDAYKLMTMDQVEFDRKYNSYYFRDRYGRRLENVRKDRKNKGRYIMLDEDAVNVTEFKNEKGSYLKPSNRLKEAEQLKQSGIKKFRDYDTKGAIEDFRKAIAISPEDKALHFNIACAYSLEEKAYEAFYHLDQAVINGFREFDKIKTHEALAFIRVMPEFDLFQQNQFRVSQDWLAGLKDKKPDDSFILKQEVPVTLTKENI